MSGANFTELSAEFEENIDNMNTVLLGDESATITKGGVVKPSISKALNDKFGEVEYGVFCFSTYLALSNYTPLQNEEKGSFKVTNDPDNNLNGYYSWVSGSNYLKNAALIIGEVDINNTDEAVNGKGVVEHVLEVNDYVNQQSLDVDEYTYILQDEDGNVIETMLAFDGLRESYYKFTADSVVNNFAYSDGIDEISSVTVNELGYVISVNYIGLIKNVALDNVDYIDEVSSVVLFSSGYVQHVIYEGGETSDGIFKQNNDVLTIPFDPNQSAFSAEGVEECAYTWWVHPLTVKFKGKVMGGGVGNKIDYSGENGAIKLWEQTNYGPMMTHEIGHQIDTTTGGDETGIDDHNPPCILIDPRPDADYPLTVFQTDHGIGNAVNRMWRAPTNKIEDLQLVGQVSDLKKCTYSQAFRNPISPDEIVLITRSSDVDQTWVFIRSLDNGDTWQRINLFKRAASSLYLGTREASDGVWIFFQTHPLYGTSQDIFVAKYNFLDGSITQPNGMPWINNVWEVTTPLDPLDGGPLLVGTPSDGKHTRLIDGRQTADNELLIIWIEFDAENYVNNQYKMAVITPSTNSISHRTFGDAGNGVPDSLAFAYFSGACIVSSTRLVKSIWDSKDDPKKSRLQILDLTDSGDSYHAVDIAYGDQKILRPLVTDEISWDNTLNKIVFKTTDNIIYLQGQYKEYYSNETRVNVKTFNMGKQI